MLIGAATAAERGNQHWWRVIPAAIVSLALQVGVNYANDYSDGVKGTDDKRVGPLRLVGSGLVAPALVKRAAFISFGVAAVAGGLLALQTTLWLVVVGLCAILAAWFYTGGPRPYGYAGLGEVFVFVFFGLVATIGTGYVVCGIITPAMWWAGTAAGCWSCAMLVVNNLRDIPGDTVSGKRTLAVRLGDARTRLFFQILFVPPVLAIAALSYKGNGPWVLMGLAGILAARGPVSVVRHGAKGSDLITVLGGVGRAQLIFGVTFAAGLFIAYS